MDTLAPPTTTLVFRRRATLEGLTLDAGLQLGAGGEAVVYEVPGDPALVAKIYRQPTIERARKLTRMLANPPRLPKGTAVAWPADVLLDTRGFAGFVMPRAEGPRVFEFYNPSSRRTKAFAFHYALLHRVGRNLAAAFRALHAAGYVVGDVNESNILVNPVNGAVTLVDADSFQVADPDTGAVFRSHVGKAEFTPPELQGIPFGRVDRGPEHDRFGLAVLLFLLLMEGTHPFAVRMEPGVHGLAVEERTRRGLFPHTSDEDDVHPPRLSPPVEMLDPALRALFVRCFADGHADPSARPSPEEWVKALTAAEAALVICARNRLHRHHPHLQACPWCERAALLGGRDPFPGGRRARRIAARSRARHDRGRQPSPAAPAPAAVPAAPRTQAPAPVPQTVSLPVQPPYGPVVANPMIALLAGLSAFLNGGGTAAGVGLIVAALAAGMLLRARRRLHGRTAVLALIVAVLVGWVVRAGFGSSGPAAPPPHPVLLPAQVAGPPPGTRVGAVVPASEVDATPRLLNRAEADAAAVAAYPAHLRQGGIGGTLSVTFLVDPEGRVIDSTIQVPELSIFWEMEDAALSVAPVMRFTPPTLNGEPVQAWITVPVTFDP